MRSAIRKHVRDVLAIVALVALAAAVAAYTLAHQRLTLPSWVPFVGQSFYTLKGDFTTAQAVTPGQGQTVDIAGVPVGEISDVQLHGGRAVVTMKLKPRYAAVYSNATMLLRPKTGLKDMVVELDPGSPGGGRRLASGATIPVGQTAPDVNLDEILSVLDADTRAYLQLLINGGGQVLRGQGADLRATLVRFDPTALDLRAITRLLAQRRANLRRVVHNFGLLSRAVAGKDRDLARLVDSADAVFGALADQEANLRLALAELPGALQDTDSALTRAGRLAGTLGPSLQALRPGARALAPALRATRPFLRDTTPAVRTGLRPLARAATPTLRVLRPAASALSAATPDLTTSGRIANRLLNELAYNPPGEGVGREGYLFWLSWVNHAGGTIFGAQDAHGAIRRAVLMGSCPTLDLLRTFGAANAQIKTLITLINLPQCPGATP